ncbi:MAG: GntR family transcriptional regulator [Planctomycetaceae bacterium]
MAQEGLLQLDSRGTARALKLTEDDLNELVDAREILEVGAFRLACQKMTPEAYDRLELKIHQIEKESDLIQLTLLDIEFHEEIIRIAGNSRLLSAWNLLRPQLQLWLASMHRLHHEKKTTTQKDTSESHRKLLKTLATGDADLCERVAREHARDLWQSLLNAQRSLAGSGVADD